MGQCEETARIYREARQQRLAEQNAERERQLQERIAKQQQSN